MSTLITTAGVIGYLAGRPCGRPFALAFGIFTAAALLVVACS